MKNAQTIRDVDECCKKIQYLLKEYNCVFDYDFKLNKILLVDKDNGGFDFPNEEVIHDSL